MKLTDEIKPIYLGYEATHKKYYFYFIKDGVPRFLVYVTYFYWALGPQTALSLVPFPENLEEELSQFLSGNLDYEFVKVRKNSKRETVRKLYRLPQQVGWEHSEDRRERGNGGSTGSTTPIASPVAREKRTESPSDEVIKVKRHRRTKAEMQELKKSQAVSVMDVSVATIVTAASSEATNAKAKRVNKRKPRS